MLFVNKLVKIGLGLVVHGGLVVQEMLDGLIPTAAYEMKLKYKVYKYLVCVSLGVKIAKLVHSLSVVFDVCYDGLVQASCHFTSYLFLLDFNDVTELELLCQLRFL